jgi:hypothetical protein
MTTIIRYTMLEEVGDEIHYLDLRSSNIRMILKHNDRESESEDTPYLLLFPADEPSKDDYIVNCESKEWGKEFAAGICEQPI